MFSVNSVVDQVNAAAAAAATVVIRRPDIVVGGLRFTAILYVLSFSSATNLRAPGTELNQNRPHARKWMRFENLCPKSGLYSTLQIGGVPKPPFFDGFTT